MCVVLVRGRRGERRAGGGGEGGGDRGGERGPPEDHGARHEALEGEAHPALQLALRLLAHQLVRRALAPLRSPGQTSLGGPMHVSTVRTYIRTVLECSSLPFTASACYATRSSATRSSATWCSAASS